MSLVEHPHWTAPGAFLIKGATVVSMDPGIGTLARGDILVRDGVIAAVGPNFDAPDAKTIDASSMIAVPGFVDGHRHLWEGLVRNALPDADIEDYLGIVNGVVAPAYTPEDAYLGQLVTALGALDAGVTCVLDWSHIQTTPEHTTATLDALRESGIRAVFAFGPPGANDRGHRWPQDLTRLCADLEADPLITPALATLSPEHVPYEQARDHFRFAREANALVSAHAGLNGIGEPGQIERFGREGLLGPDVNLVHCNTLSPAEWRIIADTGTSVSITPSTEMQMGQGIPPVQAARDVGVVPAIGVDVEVSAASDLWTQMRILLGVQRSAALELRYAGKKQPELMTTQELLECATLGGAIACGLRESIGSLTPGKQADIVLLRTDMIHSLPINDPVSAVVHSMDARNVDTVLVGGRVVKRHGALLGVDLPRLIQRLYDNRDGLYSAAGATLSAPWPAKG
jgi:5-methylthioadenosine/S-adenosylhomocysteine deaminase